MNRRKEIYIFIGPPGAGKGSLAQLCMQQLGWVQLSTGALCRKHVAENTEIGKQIDFAIKSGKLIADELIIDMVEQWLHDNVEQKKPIILDGFPRTVAQAKALDELLNKKLNCSVSIIKLELPDETIIHRLSGRFVCQNKDCQAIYSMHKGSLQASKKTMVCDVCESPLMRRPDDQASTVHERLKGYHVHEKNLLEYYRSNKRNINELDVAKPLEHVFEDFKLILNSKVK